MKAATTPGIALAAERSMEAMRPWATVLRTSARWSTAGHLQISHEARLAGQQGGVLSPQHARPEHARVGGSRRWS